jgi:hypothetical protein
MNNAFLNFSSGDNFVLDFFGAGKYTGPEDALGVSPRRWGYPICDSNVLPYLVK